VLGRKEGAAGYGGSRGAEPPGKPLQERASQSPRRVLEEPPEGSRRAPAPRRCDIYSLYQHRNQLQDQAADQAAASKKQTKRQQ
jgi:hypothetical protein